MKSNPFRGGIYPPAPMEAWGKVLVAGIGAQNTMVGDISNRTIDGV